MKHEITISCSKQNLRKIRQFVVHTLEKYHIEDVESHKMVLAVDEVCANLIIHANKCDPSNKISIIVKVEPENEIQFLIKHGGDGFDINTYKEPGIDELVSSRRKGGLGLMLVKRIMDEISFTTEKNHNICTLIKHLK